MDEEGISLLACARCRGSLASTKRTCECMECGVRFDCGDFIDMLDATTTPEPTTMDQRIAESTLYARLYEKWWRPWFVRFTSGNDSNLLTGGFGSEYFVHKQSLGLDHIDGPWLDLSCGTGLFTRGIASSCPSQSVIGVDISIPMLEAAHAKNRAYDNVTLLRADAHELPLKSGVFSGVNNAGALHAYRAPEDVFREVRRVLRSGGVYVGSAFLQSSSFVRRRLASLVGIRTFDQRELAGWLSRVGFRDYEEAIFGDIIIFKVRKP